VHGLHNNARYLDSICFCFTFLSLHTLVSFWYYCRFSTAFICSGSNKSFDSTLVGPYTTSAFVLALRSLISSGVTSSSPYNNLKGVNLAALHTEVLWLHTALSNSLPTCPSTGPPIFSLLLRILVCLLFLLCHWTKDDTLR
jgi:hypothetical protein